LPARGEIFSCKLDLLQCNEKKTEYNEKKTEVIACH
jgi:hypothetical protein